MERFTEEELQKRAFYRIAWVLWHFWEEQKDDPKQRADVHSRLFDTLIHRPLILIGESINGGGHYEHLVPCALLRDRAFEMFHHGNRGEDAINDVAKMLERFLRVAHISREEARLLDHGLGLKTTMPKDWDFETGSVMRRLEEAKIALNLGPNFSTTH
jgi:hypothetical protein